MAGKEVGCETEDEKVNDPLTGYTVTAPVERCACDTDLCNGKYTEQPSLTVFY